MNNPSIANNFMSSYQELKYWRIKISLKMQKFLKINKLIKNINKN